MEAITKKIGNIAVVEFKSVSRGISVTDAMIKAADVRTVLSTTLCPGKYLTIVSGDVSAIESSKNIADELGGRHVFSSFVVNGVGQEIIDAIGGKLDEDPTGAISVIESLQMANLINAADLSMDAADVGFLDFRLGRGCGVNCFYVLTGTLTDIKEATGVAIDFLKSLGSLIAYKIVASPDRELIRFLRSSYCNC